MNAPFIVRPGTPIPGAPRKYTADDIHFFSETGLLDPDAKFELLDGEIVPMSPKGRFHEVMREKVELWLKQPWAQAFNCLREHTIRIDDRTLLEPDYVLYDSDRLIADSPLTGPDIRLAIEVADSSWSYDIDEKAAKYAAFGIAEYWVLNAVTQAARVHREPSPEGWGKKRAVQPGKPLAPLCAPKAKLTL